MSDIVPSSSPSTGSSPTLTTTTTSRHVEISVKEESTRSSSNNNHTKNVTPNSRRIKSILRRTGHNVAYGVKTGATRTGMAAWKVFENIEAFLENGNVIDLAVGVIMGAAFTSIIQSFVQDLITPFIGLATQKNIENNFMVLRCPTITTSGTTTATNDTICQLGIKHSYQTPTEATNAGAVTWNWGRFMQTFINFMLVSTITFFFVKLYAASFVKFNSSPPPKMKRCGECAEECHSKARQIAPSNQRNDAIDCAMPAARKHSQSTPPAARMSQRSQAMSRVSTSIQSHPSLLMALPAEIIPLITVYLHPHQLHALRRLCRSAQQRLAIPPSFSFALNNMRALCASDIRSNRNSIFSPTLNWSSLGPVYMAAYIAVAGVSYSSLQVMGIDYEESTALDISTEAAALLSNALILAAQQDGLSRRRWNKPIVRWEMCESLVVQIAAISGWSSVLQAIASHVPGFAASHANLILDYTAQNGHSEIVTYLLEHWSAHLNLGYLGSSAFRHACANGHAQVVLAILEQADRVGGNLNVKAHDNYALMKAAENGHSDIVDILLRHCRNELDPSAYNCHALRVAVENGHTSVVQALLDDGRCDTTELPKEHQEVLEAYIMHLASESRIPGVVESLVS
ncbi:hypothetical protein HDU81_005757 [Chytriomyces hyalinus]|nr:hypothetical protein HDU81_005757 [Chytriomyces hyalinus]